MLGKIELFCSVITGSSGAPTTLVNRGCLPYEAAGFTRTSIQKIHLVTLRGICLWPNTQWLNQSVSFEEPPPARAGSYRHNLGVTTSKQSSRSFKNNNATRQEVSVAAIASF